MSSLTSVAPVSPVAAYMGGKRNLARRICSIIDAVDCDSYAEPFVGMGGIFLRRRRRPKVEVINDISGDVVTLFRVLREHYTYFLDMLRFRLASRSDFERLAGQNPECLTDLQRAVRFLHLQRLAFGGKVNGRTFGVDPSQGARFNVNKLEPMLADLHERLAGVTIEQLPFDAFISRYDRSGTFFYLDPPYWGCEDDYGPGVFSRDDFDRLADALRNLRGRFLLSLNDRPEVRTMFEGFHVRQVETSYSLSTAASGQAKRAGELLISNFTFPSG